MDTASYHTGFERRMPAVRSRSTVSVSLYGFFLGLSWNTDVRGVRKGVELAMVGLCR